MKIIPSLIAKNQKEFDERYKRVQNLSKEFHLDVMDGKFVKNKSLLFRLKLPKEKYSVHLMMKNPLDWIETNSNKVQSIIIQVESDNLEPAINLIKKKKRKVGLAINPKTKLTNLSNFISKIDFILVLSVNPGSYGSKFQPAAIKRIKEIKKMTKKPIWVDGSINDRTIKRFKGLKINNFIVGSYLQKEGKEGFDKINSSL